MLTVWMSSRCGAGETRCSSKRPDCRIVLLPDHDRRVGASDLYLRYHQFGTIPDTYTLRPVEGYRRDGSRVDIDDAHPAR